jgi:hypothetical protein
VLTDGLAQKRLQISGWLLGEDRDTPYDGSSETLNPLQERTKIRVWLLTGDIRIGTMWGVQVTAAIPDVTRSAVVVSPTSTFFFSETFQGLGDSSVLAWRRRVSSTGWNMTLNAGASVPTGKTEQPHFRSELQDESLVPISRLQRGTGTVDPVFGVSANRVVTSILPPGIRVFINGAARVPLVENTWGLRTGASWELGGGASREIKLHQIVGILRTSWLHREQDVFDGTPVLVGGGDWLNLAPSLALSLGPVTVQTELKFPLYRHLSNRQLDSSLAFQVGAIWAIR